MTAEELYQKEFGDADSVPKESVIRLLQHFAKVLKMEREQSLRTHNVAGLSKQCEHPWASVLGDGEMSPAKCLKCGKWL